MSDAIPDEAGLRAEIEQLKAEFPGTRDLYREVCALLFFRYGVTPTANRLYQLVRRGSMSTPVAVLAGFWADLREKSRVRIEHADLPEELREAAGELVAMLWKRAAGAARDALTTLRDEVEAVRLAAEASVATLQADLARTESALGQHTDALLAAQVRIQELEQAQAAAAATRDALEGELARVQQVLRERDMALAQARTDFAAELEKQRASTDLAETRLQAAERRALLEIERERSANTRLQRAMESAQQRAARDVERAQAEIQSLQTQVGDLRHQAGVLEGRLEAMRASHAAQAQEVRSVRQKASSADGAARRAPRRMARQSSSPAKAAARKRGAKT
ncbi:DNA-binding protein [Paraburkholderia rhizosphaerae]|uniref:Plasmid replication DNA-binding protein KfrA n=1 Tax=Paraburkholderia rhizosphaerae TaxID=480658 RepID=A0A4R8LRJ2_9BURK|nr:DNA-binding protein [Paraburkholderia rhizosphaerae]TDY48173.1 plasmid replication DNA-binding protein KfrA [Paraburkholderia rhizosphaerae]